MTNMRFERKHSILLLGILYVIVLVGMYRALVILGPLDPSLLRWEGDPMEQGYKIFFFHLPCGITTYLAFAVTLVASIGYLKSRNLKWDIVASSSAKLGLVFCTLALITGAMFSKIGWGAYWNWDPRQTTTLILWFIYAAYFSLRSAIEDEEARARLSSILGIFGFVGVPLSYISTRIWTSMHPIITEGKGLHLDPMMVKTLLIMLFGIVVLYAYLLWLDVKLKNINREYRKLSSIVKK